MAFLAFHKAAAGPAGLLQPHGRAGELISNSLNRDPELSSSTKWDMKCGQVVKSDNQYNTELRVISVSLIHATTGTEGEQGSGMNGFKMFSFEY